ncbi:hypothetical protein U3516DRAFT_737416 [Neocallimastix sp. 'constans']
MNKEYCISDKCISEYVRPIDEKNKLSFEKKIKEEIRKNSDPLDIKPKHIINEVSQ